VPKIPESNSATRAGDRMVYKGYVDDAFHYMDERARYDHGSFRTADEAIAACRRIVGSDLADYAKQNSGITAAHFYELYVMFGHDPLVCRRKVPSSQNFMPGSTQERINAGRP
jgi:hypothetical protein